MRSEGWYRVCRAVRGIFGRRAPLAALLLSSVLCGPMAGNGAQAGYSGLDQRPANDGPKCEAPPRPQAATTLAVEEWFAGQGMRGPIFLAQPPGDASRLYVAERVGLLKMSTLGTPAPSPLQVALDITARVRFDAVSVDESDQKGITGFAFHPDFPAKPYVYVAYNTRVSMDSLAQSFVSRFELGGDGWSFVAGSETVLLEVPQTNRSHHIGTVLFGPDRMLYIGLGEGSVRNRARDLGDLRGKILRVDVDGGAPYGIPADNPFVGSPGARPEIYAWGFRNPWRFSFDSQTGALWLGDVGLNDREEVNLVTAGGNYGWPVLEGTRCVGVAGGNCADPSLIPPVFEFDHDTGFNAVIGGYVYRGAAMPGLQGTYVFGFPQGLELWGLKKQGDVYAQVKVMDLPAGPGVHSFSQDNAGELYLLSVWEGRIRKLVAGPAGGGEPTIPTRLSATGCVDPDDPTRPAPGMIPFAVRVPLWSDGAEKQRFLALPDGTLPEDAGKVTVLPNGDLDFPIGTVFSKTFSYPKDGKDTPFETRLFMRHPDGGWAGYSYEWRDDGSDADLLPDTKIKVIRHDGGSVTWTYPSRSQCLLCHTEVAGFVLGPEIPQLNHDMLYASTGRRANQLSTWEHIGLFDGGLPAPPAALPAFPAPADTVAPFSSRARAYLHANCSHCHRPGGPTRAQIDLRATTDFAAMNVCNVAPSIEPELFPGAMLLLPGDPDRSVVPMRMKRRDGVQMPPLATTLADPLGVPLIRNWIKATADCTTGPDSDVGADGEPDGIADAADNCIDTFNPDQRDSDFDGYGDACDADFNNDGIVDNVDLRLLGPLNVVRGSGGFQKKRDLNGDDAVNRGDYAILKRLYGAPPGPSWAHP